MVLPLTRLLPLRSFVTRKATVIGFTVGRWWCLFPYTVQRLARSSSPEAYRYGSGSFSLEATPPQSAFNSVPAHIFRSEPWPARVSSLSRHHCSAGNEQGFLGPHSDPSAGVLSLSTVFSAVQLAGLFHPAAEPRALSRSRVCPLRAAALSLREPWPPRRCLGTPHPQASGRCTRASTSRLFSTRSRVP